MPARRLPAIIPRSPTTHTSTRRLCARCSGKWAICNWTKAKEVKRRAKVVEIFPDDPSVIRLVGTLLAEADDEWQIQRRYFSQESMRHLYEPELARLVEPTSLTLAPVH